MGCGKPADFKKVVQSTKPEARVVQVGKGEVTRRTVEQVPLWTVVWTNAMLEYTDDRKFSGEMAEVSGTIYQNGKPASTYHADWANARKEDAVLELSGHVKVTSLSPVTSIGCEKVQFDGESATIKADGSVLVQAQEFQTGPWDSITASSDLSTIATTAEFPTKK